MSPELGGLLRRHPANPILTAANWPRTVNAVFNPAATIFDNETLLLIRVEDRRGVSRLDVARSHDGLGDWVIEPDRGLMPDASLDSDRFGIEDPRITRIGDDYYVAYTGFSDCGPVVCLAATRDFRTWKRHGVIMPPEDKDAALFPRQFDGRFALLHRPVASSPSLAAHIWMSFSPDLRHWGDHRVLLPAREGSWWDAHKVGLGAPPLLTAAGWLILYHGVHLTAAGAIYRLGLALLAEDDPSTVLARSSEWIFGPEEPYERSGDVPQVVFSCGWVLAEDGDTLRVYYGAADTCIGVATASLAELLGWLAKHS